MTHNGICIRGMQVSKEELNIGILSYDNRNKV